MKIAVINEQIIGEACLNYGEILALHCSLPNLPHSVQLDIGMPDIVRFSIHFAKDATNKVAPNLLQDK